jgi:ArsR family transcriptional regulator
MFNMDGADADLTDALAEGDVDTGSMVAEAQAATAFLKALSHEGRLMILCHLTTGEKSVSELENLLSSRQAAVSQQLARLRAEGIVTRRRLGKAIHYRLADPKAERMVALLYEMFCDQP